MPGSVTASNHNAGLSVIIGFFLQLSFIKTLAVMFAKNVRGTPS